MNHVRLGVATVTDGQDRLAELQQAYEERGEEVFEELRKEDPALYAMVMSEAAGLLGDEGKEEEQPTRAVNVDLMEGETRERA